MNESSNLSSAMSDCTDDPIVERPTVFWTFTALYLLVFLSCFIGNLFLFVVLITHRSMRTATNFFLANLAAADLLVGVFCIVQNWARLFMYTTWHLGEGMCYLYVFVLHAVPCISAGILVLVSAEKYIALQHPLWARKVLTNRLRMGMTLSVWVTGFATNWPLMHSIQYFTFDGMHICAINNNFDLEKLFYRVSFVIWYIVPVLIMSVLYANIGCLLWQTTSGVLADATTSGGALSSSITSQTSPTRVPTAKKTSFVTDTLTRNWSKMSRASNRSSMHKTHSMASTSTSESRRRVVRLLVAVVLAFSVLSLPHHVRLLWRYSKPRGYHYCISAPVALWQPIAYIMIFTNSGINPFLYAFLSQRFRAASADLLYGCLGRQRPAGATVINANGTTLYNCNRQSVTMVRDPNQQQQQQQQRQQQQPTPHQNAAQLPPPSPMKKTTVVKCSNGESFKRRLVMHCADSTDWKMSGESEMTDEIMQAYEADPIGFPV